MRDFRRFGRAKRVRIPGFRLARGIRRGIEVEMGKGRERERKKI